MMNAKTLRLVLLVSCCHALVHVYEMSFASVEQLVATEYGVDTQVTGMLGTSLRLPYGLCAILAGWLADRFGAKRLLLVYLLGSSVAALIACRTPGLGILFLAMFTMGMFTSIYHPAGVGLISHQTRPENRPMALGYHGIFGSVGVAAGPFLASFVLASAASWRQYYLVLTIPGVVLALMLLSRLSHEQQNSAGADPQAPASGSQDQAQWNCYSMLLMVTMLAGFVYAAVLTFLPRYLAEANLDLEAIMDKFLELLGLGGATIRPVSVGNFLTGLVLLLGVLGQFTAGRIARPTTLEPLMALTFFATAPFLFWMGVAEGLSRVWAAAVFAPLFFMHQPLYNSLVAKYVPRRRRSLGYGLSFTLAFGVGSIGSTFAGTIQSELVNYRTLGTLMLVAGVLAILLWRRSRGDGRPRLAIAGRS